jgi:hypothetical protein
LRLAEQLVEMGFQRFPVGQRVEELRLEQRGEDARPARQKVGKPRRRAEDLGEQADAGAGAAGGGECGRNASRAPPRSPPWGARNPWPLRVSRVSGSSSSPVKTRLPLVALSSGALEQLRVMALHLAHVAEHVLGQRLGRLVAGEAGEGGECVLVLGQAVGLLVGDHLDAVLDPRRKR